MRMINIQKQNKKLNCFIWSPTSKPWWTMQLLKVAVHTSICHGGISPPILLHCGHLRVRIGGWVRRHRCRDGSGCWWWVISRITTRSIWCWARFTIAHQNWYSYSPCLVQVGSRQFQGLVLPLSFALVPSVLEPDLDLCRCQLEHIGKLFPFWSW